MTKHRLDYELCPSGHWGWCSCGEWSTGPNRGFADDEEGEAEVADQWRTHVSAAAEAEADSVGWPQWDDPDDVGDDW